ncbi:unnamed protein product [Mytilus edulis]|uniref:Uncharacterized protein n=1 Tax=Mytilus edulis TaxID=6550 RepID=A0A8S3UX89_MYTED|nr:unnamed protein product [Mytilus edulis]
MVGDSFPCMGCVVPLEILHVKLYQQLMLLLVVTPHQVSLTLGKQSVCKLLKYSSPEQADLLQLSSSDICVVRKRVSELYDLKGQYKSSHHDLNKLRVRLATSKDCSLVRLPPSESSFEQHVLRHVRASIHTNYWIKSHQLKPPNGSTYGYGWEKCYNGPTPVLFAGRMS